MKKAKIIFSILFISVLIQGCTKKDEDKKTTTSMTYTGTPTKNPYEIAINDFGDLSSATAECYMCNGDKEIKLPYTEENSAYDRTHTFKLWSDHLEVWSTDILRAYMPPVALKMNGVQWSYKLVVTKPIAVIRKYGYPLDRSTVNKLVVGD